MDSPHSFISFRDVVETHKKALYYLSLKLTGNHHDAEDLSQEVFMKAHKGMNQFRGEAQMYTWLRRIAINTFLNKKRKKAVSMMGLLEDDEPNTTLHSTGPNADEQASYRVTSELVNQALNNLSPRERTAFTLKHHQELSIAEVSSVMEVADGTVKSLLFRATKKLQLALAHLHDSTQPSEVASS